MLNLSYKFHVYRSYIVKRFFPEISKNVYNFEYVLKLANTDKVRLFVWSTRLKDEGIHPEHPNLEVIHLEDGFIRSVGLGVIFTPPISIVADRRGIYFDSTEQSDIEYILSTYTFEQEVIERARKLIDMIKTKRIDKYNISQKSWTPPKTQKKIIIAVGQVESDKSIRYGSPYIKTNIDLLKTIRKYNPDDYIIYRPHPDVAGGYRKGGYSEKVIREYADSICIMCDKFSLLEIADEIHTINSLFGFEALLWGKKVVCYGQPFYCSWGLTQDIYPVHRRRRKLSLEELFAGSIILYPIYVSLISGRRIEPEEAIEEIELFKKKKPLKWRLYSTFQNIIKPLLKMRRL